MERNVYLLVAYDGTDFHGWQNQTGLRTVQNEVEQAIRRAVRHRVSITGSGRTDAGVHAAGHVSNFRTTCELPPDKLRHSIGSRLPSDVSIEGLRDVSPAFHATQCAISKLYRYRIFSATHHPVGRLAQRFTHHFWKPLDVERMKEGASYFIGKRDFSAMAASGGQRESMVRTVFRCEVERHYDEIRIDVEGDGFLYKQVRNMVGTLLNVGRGSWRAEHVAEVLTSRDRTKAGPTAPARGLCLQWLRYPPALLVAEREVDSGPAVEANG